MLSRANSRFFKKIILRFRREIKKFGRSISLLSNPDIRWNNREIPLDKATCLTNNSIVIRKRIAAGCNDSNRISCYLKIDESLFALLVIYLYDGQLLLKKSCIVALVRTFVHGAEIFMFIICCFDAIYIIDNNAL